MVAAAGTDGGAGENPPGAFGAAVFVYGEEDRCRCRTGPKRARQATAGPR
jgi:hypothetical protein